MIGYLCGFTCFTFFFLWGLYFGFFTDKAKLAAREYKNAMHLFPPNKNNWIPKVEICSSIDNSGVEGVFDMIEEFKTKVIENGSFEGNRIEQDKMWLTDTLKELLLSDFFSDAKMLVELKELKETLCFSRFGSVDL